MNCELINDACSGLCYKTHDLSKETHLRCSDIPMYVKTILDIKKCGRHFPNNTTTVCNIRHLRNALNNSKYSIKKDIPPSEYFTEWEQFTQVINTIIDIAIIHNTDSIKLIFNG